jgi:DNA polymerase I-like protein with 3'-5' exonuclease and polymerase domains
MFDADLHVLKLVVQAGYSTKFVKPTANSYQWAKPSDLINLARQFRETPPPYLALDTESVGTHPLRNETRLLTVQLSWGPGTGLAVPIDYNPFRDYANWEVLPDAEWKPNQPVNPAARTAYVHHLKMLLCGTYQGRRLRLVGHNLKHDIRMARHKLPLELSHLYEDDTLNEAHLIDENMLSHELSECVRRWVRPMAGYSDLFDSDPVHLGKTRMDLVPPGKMLNYGCGDTDATWRLHQTIEPILKEDKALYNCYRVEKMPAQRAFTRVEDRGFYIDVAALRAFKVRLEKHQKAERQRLKALVPKEIADKWEATGVGFRLTRGDFIRDFLFTHPKGLRLKPRVFTRTKQISVSTKLHLPFFADDNDFVRDLIDFIKNDRLLTSFVGEERDESGQPTGFFKYIYNGNRLNPTYLLTGTDTGRTSSRDPNGQNLPKRGIGSRAELIKAYRKIFVAPPGWVLIEADYSQIELRVAAIMANEKTMLRIYREGGDVHEMTAAAVMKLSIKAFRELDAEIRKFRRFQAKAVNFGFLYSMWWKKFRSYAKTDYGIDLTDAEAKEMRETYFRTYPGLAAWHEAMTNQIMEHAFVRAFNGQVRHLPNVRSDDEDVQRATVRQGINAPVQCFANALGLQAIAAIDSDPAKSAVVKVCGFVHDAIIAMARVENVAAACRIIHQTMETLPLGKLYNFKSPIPITAEVGIGYNLAEIVELKPKWYEHGDTLGVIRGQISLAADAANDNKAKGELLKQSKLLRRAPLALRRAAA